MAHNDSYTISSWQTGDVITQEKLNKLEYGVKNATFGFGNGLQFDEANNKLEVSSTISELGDEVNSIAGRVTTLEAQMQAVIVALQKVGIEYQVIDDTNANGSSTENTETNT